MESIFNIGSTPSLDEVLQNRERRASLIKKLLTIYPDCSLISFKLNIAGPIKNNIYIRKIFELGLSQIQNCINNDNLVISYSKTLDIKTGPEYFALIKTNSKDIKTKMTNIEEKSKLGRLFDIDVLYMDNDKLEHISRADIGFENRKCFVCQADARQCAGSRAHSLTSIYESMYEIISSEINL